MSDDFRARVETMVAQIPQGRVMTYGQIAALCGQPRAARIVGGIAHFGDPALPWQRVVNRHGGLASGYPGGRAGHRQVLEAEGISVTDYRVDVNKLIWWPADQPPLLVIVGETASGKSALAMHLAQEFDGEIIAADSTTIRRQADIGTAKPTPEEQTAVPHHLIDIVEPDQGFTAAQFKELANAAITDIAHRGKLPIMVGGTGLYIDSVLYDYQFRPAADTRLRDELNELSRQELLQKIVEQGIELGDTDTHNKRRLIRLIETDGQRPAKQTLRANTLIIGLQTDRETLRQRITTRLDRQISEGLEAEVRGLAERYGWACEALGAIAYAQWRDYFLGAETLAQVHQKIVQASLDLAKRQRTWFRRNKSIHWISTPVNQSEVVDLVTTFLDS